MKNDMQVVSLWWEKKQESALLGKTQDLKKKCNKNYSPLEKPLVNLVMVAWRLRIKKERKVPITDDFFLVITLPFQVRFKRWSAELLQFIHNSVCKILAIGISVQKVLHTKFFFLFPIFRLFSRMV